MKIILALMAIAAVASAKFQYTEEWELWKKVTFTERRFILIHSLIHDCIRLVLNNSTVFEW